MRDILKLARFGAGIMSPLFDSRGALVFDAFEPTSWLGHLRGRLAAQGGRVRHSEETH
tara:strand:- start:515 stop:688 length:174 start_codon:yes stop_codon:yes gene_type:complete